jgi:hypothetical protein
MNVEINYQEFANAAHSRVAMRPEDPQWCSSMFVKVALLAQHHHSARRKSAAEQFGQLSTNSYAESHSSLFTKHRLAPLHKWFKKIFASSGVEPRTGFDDLHGRTFLVSAKIDQDFSCAIGKLDRVG